MSFAARSTIAPTSLSSSLLKAMNGSLNSPSGNHSNATESQGPYSERMETYLVPVVFAVIFIVGVLGNGTLVLIFIRHRNMRNIPNTYIFSLALGDLLVILICVPFTATVYTFESWPYGLAICKVSETAKDVSIGVSVFTLTALSADRFFAIVDPMRKLHTGSGGRRATRVTYSIAACVWVAALVCAVPAALHSHLRNFHSFVACYPFSDRLGPSYASSMVTARLVLYYVIPLLVIAVFYSLMARHLMRSTRNMPGEMQGQAKQVRARKKVAKMVLSFVVVFAVCFFPHHLFMMWFYHSPTSQEDYNAVWHSVRIVGFCLSYGNSCINPIALYCVSGTFRKHFKRYLFCRGRRRTLGRGGKGSGGGGGGGGGGGRRNSYSLTGGASRRGAGTFASTLSSSTRMRSRCTGGAPSRSLWESTTVAPPCGGGGSLTTLTLIGCGVVTARGAGSQGTSPRLQQRAPSPEGALASSSFMNGGGAGDGQ